jgi:hypothetical protein
MVVAPNIAKSEVDPVTLIEVNSSDYLCPLSIPASQNVFEPLLRREVISKIALFVVFSHVNVAFEYKRLQIMEEIVHTKRLEVSDL